VHETPLFEALVNKLIVGDVGTSLLGPRHPARSAAGAVRGDVRGPVAGARRVPAAAAGDMSRELQDVVVSPSLTVLVVADIPGRHGWQRFATSAGDPRR
jgi:hypothetical protein